MQCLVIPMSISSHRLASGARLLAAALGAIALGSAAPVSALRISAAHPRLLVRADSAAIGAGPRVSELRRRQHRPELDPYGALPSGETSWEAQLTPALQALLAGDIQAQARVRAWLLEKPVSAEHSSGRQAAGHAAIAFDWLHATFTPIERRRVADHVCAGADAALTFLRTGKPDIDHNFTYMALFSVLAAGLALHDEPGFEAAAAGYLRVARDWLEGPGGVYDACAARDGAWPEGNQYGFTECTRLLVLLLHCLRSATNEDPFAAVRVRHGDFLRGTARVYMAMARPDLTLERLGDMNQFKPLLRDQHRFVIEALADGLRRDGGEPRTAAMLEFFSDLVHAAYGGRDTHRNFNWGMILFADPDAPRDPRGYADQPLVQVFGRGSLDLVVMRHGWDEEGTFITFQAGDHFLDHQHFDKGSFTIYHRGALAIDSGAYDRMYSAHHRNYATRTIAHNAPLVFDPGLVLPEDYARDGGQRVLRGFQHHARWGDFLAHRASEQLDAADLLAAESGLAPALAASAGSKAAPFAAWAVAQAELSGAYGDAVHSLRRTLAYWPAAQLVVVHDAYELDSPLDVAFVLHAQQPPQAAGAGSPVPGDSMLGAVPWWLISAGGQLDLGVREVQYDGRLFVRTLWPEAHRARRIGGPRFEWSVNGVNHKPAGNAGAPREAGAWRVEVHAPKPATRQRMIHVLQIADPSIFQMAPCVALHTSSGWSGAHVSSAPEAVLAVPEDTPAALPLRYDVTSALPCVHVVLGLEPRAAIEVRSGGTARTLRASSEGILAFDDREIGPHAIVLQPASAGPPGS